MAKILKVSESFEDKRIFVYKSIVSGGIAGALTNCIVYPIDFARTRLSADLGKSKSQRQFTGISDCLKKTYMESGIRGVYRGLNAAIFGIFIYRGLFFGLYDSGKLLFPATGENYLSKILFAQCVVIISETISYPTDTIKRRLMMQSEGFIKYRNSIHATVIIHREEGWMGFMRGSVSNMVRGFGGAICLVMFDELKRVTN